MNQEFIMLVEGAAKIRGEKLLVPRSFIAKALVMIEKGEEKAEKYPTGNPSLKDAYDIAAKLFNASRTNCGGASRETEIP